MGPLRHSTFRAMWIAMVVSQVGSFIQIVATGWAMTALTASVAMVALVQTAANLPVMLFGILAGALADLHPRRSIMLAAQLVMLIFSASLTILAASGLLTPALLLGATFLIGCGAALNGPAWQAAVGDLVPRRDIPAAVATNIVGNNVARSVGPAAGGLAVATVGLTSAFLMNTLSYLGLLAILWRWTPPKTLRGQGSLAHALKGGFRYGFGAAGARQLFIRALIFSAGAAAVWSLMPVVALRLGGDASMLGLLFAAFGVGGVVGAVGSVFVRGRKGSEAVAQLGTAAVAAASLALGFTESVPVAVVAHALAGAGWVSGLSTFNVSIQLGIPRPLVGRVLAIYQTIAFGGLALGSAAWGVVAEVSGLVTAFVAAGLLTVVGGLLGARLGLPPPISSGDL
ncbi:MAG TPA: MFS transporter [Allosphingosinicella sp.]|nr:MFS transporter [Allosphingosinicella sp.]